MVTIKKQQVQEEITSATSAIEKQAPKGVNLEGSVDSIITKMIEAIQEV